MHNFLVTGAAGFIGSHLVEKLLDEGNHVIGVDNFDPFYPKNIKQNNFEEFRNHDNFDFYDVNVSSEDFALALANSTVETIIHLSARAGVRPSFLFPRSYVHHDVEATVNILDACVKFGIKNLIFGSSSSVYGNIPNLPYKEDFKLDTPISPYAAAKLSCELFNHVYHSQYGLNVTNLRFFTVYGPRQRPEMGIHKFTRQIYNKLPITMYGDGTSSRDYTYITDIVEGIFLASKKVKGFETYNLGNNYEVTLSDLINVISKKLGIEAIIKQQPQQPGDVDHTYADITKAQRELGYSPKVSIDEGIEKFVSWFLSD